MYYYSETSVLGFLGFQNPCKNALNREFKWIFWHDFRIVTRRFWDIEKILRMLQDNLKWKTSQFSSI
jgi:hypothetical protein